MILVCFVSFECSCFSVTLCCFAVISTGTLMRPHVSMIVTITIKVMKCCKITYFLSLEILGNHTDLPYW